MKHKEEVCKDSSLRMLFSATAEHKRQHTRFVMSEDWQCSEVLCNKMILMARDATNSFHYWCSCGLKCLRVVKNSCKCFLKPEVMFCEVGLFYPTTRNQDFQNILNYQYYENSCQITFKNHYLSYKTKIDVYCSWCITTWETFLLLGINDILN